MSKRKREDEKDSEVLTVGKARRSLDPILERSKQALFRALKLARGFERQKLGRRQKVAQKATDAVSEQRLATEVAVLKSLDLNILAETYLYRSLAKIRILASTPSISSLMQGKVTADSKPLNSATANVQARLFNSQPVKTAVGDLISTIRVSLRLSDEPNGKIKRLRKGSTAQRQDIAGNGLSLGLECNGMKVKNEGGPNGSSLDKPQIASSDDEGIDYDKYESRFAGFSDESHLSERSGEISKTLFHKLAKTSTFDSTQNSPSPMLSDQSSTTPTPPPPDVKLSNGPMSNTKATTFLPSLMGGYWSGSEPASDIAEDEEARNRKNRRGQRERRLIAEKKYGQNANHLRKQGQRGSRDEGWDLRRGAQGSDRRGKRGRGRGGPNTSFHGRIRTSGGGPMNSGANSAPVGNKRNITKGKDGSLHPSWEAARKAKEQKQTIKFEGKKVIFD